VGLFVFFFCKAATTIGPPYPDFIPLSQALKTVPLSPSSDKASVSVSFVHEEAVPGRLYAHG